MERKYINHIDNLQLSESTDINLVIDGPKVPDEEVMLESDEMNYSQLREMQRRTTHR